MLLGPDEISAFNNSTAEGPGESSMQTQIQGDFRRKSNTACGPCKKRKIRCDRLSPDSAEQPCSACRRHGWNCAVALDHDGPSATKRQRLDRRHRPRTESGTSGTVSSSTVDIASPPAASIPDESPVSISHPSLASADSLKDFYERGIGSDWEVFARAPDKDPLRIVYTGSAIANLNQLVQPSSYALHLPFPSIRPRLDWEPIPGSRAYLTSAVARDLSSLPARHIRDSLIDTYFTFIHPGLPIVDAVEFQVQYASANPSPPLLLLQCMLLAAARVSTHPEVAASRNDMTATIYRRAKALFEMRHENDRVLLVQSALLLTWHVEDADSVSNGPYYWTGLATRIALGLAMHRDLSDASASRMPAADRRLYRRLWWTTLRFEVYTALEFGRPSMIRAEDFDQPALEPGDFLSGDGSNDNLACPEFCILDARLCTLALEIIRLAAPGTMSLADEAAAIDQQLILLAAELPSTLDFWSCQLRITHSMLIIMLHRARKQPDADSASAAHEAVSAILISFETILSSHKIAHLHYYACTPLLAAAIHLTHTVISSETTPSSMKAYTSHIQLERLLRPIETLAQTWPHMDSVHKLSKLLSSHCRRTVFKPTPSAEQAPFDLADITLDDLLGEYCFPTFTRPLEESDPGILSVV